jgi:hypothetical protein
MDNDYDGGAGMSTYTFPVRGLEPINCEPWCEASDGHPDQRLPEDQCCVGPEHRVALLQEPTEHFGEASTEQQYLNTYLMRPAGDPAARVFIGYNEAPGRPATSDEARRFALQILALVDELEASPVEVSPRLHAEPIKQRRAPRL